MSASTIKAILRKHNLPKHAIETLIRKYKCNTVQKLAELGDDFVAAPGRQGLQNPAYINAIRKARDAARFRQIKLAFDELHRKGILPWAGVNPYFVDT